MNNVHNLNQEVAEFREMLKGGGGGGTYDGMEQRVRQLETDMSFIKGKLEDMPTKDWMNTRMLAYFGATIAIIGLLIKIL